MKNCYSDLLCKLYCVLILAFVSLSTPVNAAETKPELYTSSFGNPTSGVVILYSHGGPGYNAASFELSAAKLLGQKHFVIVYDRSSDGRSKNVPGNPFTYEYAVAEMNRVLEKYHFSPDRQRLVIVGHSFGGTLGLRYLDATKNPNVSLILVNTPVSYLESSSEILDRCARVYESKKDDLNLGYIKQLRAMDKESLEYTRYALGHSILCGLQAPRGTPQEVAALSQKIQQSPLGEWLVRSEDKEFVGMYTKERFSIQDDTALVERNRNRIYLIYSDEDFSISSNRRQQLRGTFKDRFVEIRNANHNVFLDNEKDVVSTVLGVVDRLPPYAAASPKTAAAK